ncbi:restriction endonuclease subunit S [Salmonella enterica subsp. enterica serovar Indiana]|uniref:restriction endonuclease subunit S n=1 Tax=Enterobacteriaceae TaxID=543 RepID=UPI001C19BB5B|nr:restriction endonuclease subunit S [Citrobacter portucalensis]EIT7461402.1 restriction endonuclease subunit S [Escherichia coli]MCC1752299.1 restriction endonuclease subunit S [Salmonella enterica subsp. enterica serovar Indiana]MCQ6995618.1 restriction endonuclease subunit S [Salmonella enterica]MCC1754134.1 restriction endonuclease subunit S [Salmonella enterica subsp. enterica serovar Indiana]MCC1765803.1 restriction endonuclease subunit S [Salmonella enterica subsp. enterica serovar Ind
MSFKVQFSHIAEIIMGQSPKGEEVNNEGIGLPLLNGPTEFTDRYPLPVQHTAFEKKTSLPGDILFCVRGSTTGKMNYSDQKYCIGRGLAAIRGRNGYPTPYVKAVLEACLPELLAAATGSTFPNVSRDLISNISVDVLSVDDAYRISKFIESQEGKVFNNNGINQTLEQIAQALFKSWFVDFEPVKAKIAVLEAGGSQEDATLAAMTAISGKDADSLAIFEQEHPEKYAELKSTAELFPSAMQDIESVKIPESWNLAPLSSIASFASGKIDVSELTKDTYISTENMLVNKMGIECATSLPSASTTPSFNPGHILISNIRPYFKKIWFARFSGGRSADVLAFEHKKHITAEYLYNVLYQDSFFDFMMRTSKGVKMPRGDKKAIMEWSCIVPTVELVSVFSNKVKEFYSYIESHNKENTQLSQLRDTLLPKLLSGEITLPDAEEIAKEADYV